MDGKAPTIDELREHFQNAIKLKDRFGDEAYYASNNIMWHFTAECYCQSMGNGLNLILWDGSEGYAEIIKTKSDERI